MAAAAGMLPAYVAIRVPHTAEIIRVRQVWPDVGDYILTPEQWDGVVAGILERHTCAPPT